MDKIHKILFSGILTAVLTFITVLIYKYYGKDSLEFNFSLILTGIIGGIFVSTFIEENYYKKIAEKIIENLKSHIHPDFFKIFPTREESEEKQFLSEPCRKLIYICISGKALTNFKKEIKEALETKEITIYLLDPYSKLAEKREGELEESPEGVALKREIRNTIEDFAKFTKDHIIDSKKTFRIYKYDTIPYFSAVILENKKSKEYYITQHLFYKRTKKCPFFHIKKKNDVFYEIYENVINKFIENNKDILFDNKENSNKAENICNGTIYD